MKKLGVIVIVLSMVSLKLIAQTNAVKPKPVGSIIGIRAGLGMSKMDFSTDDQVEHSWLTKPIGGIFARFGLSEMFSIQPEILYYVKGVKYASTLNTSTFSSNGSLEFTYIEIPVLARLELKPADKIDVGIFVGISTGVFVEGVEKEGITINGISKDTTLSVHDDQVHSPDFGIVVGSSIDYELSTTVSLGLDVRYTLGQSDIAKDQSSKTDFIVHNKAISFTLQFGYHL